MRIAHQHSTFNKEVYGSIREPNHILHVYWNFLAVPLYSTSLYNDSKATKYGKWLEFHSYDFMVAPLYSTSLTSYSKPFSLSLDGRASVESNLRQTNLIINESQLVTTLQRENSHLTQLQFLGLAFDYIIKYKS